MPLDTATLLAPIDDAAPTGIDIRQDEHGAPIYYKLKDARSTARLAERRADAEPEAAQLAPEWRVIHELAQEVLSTRSKDLEVAVWLAEASLRIDGYAGLHDALAVIDGLVERYWDTLHSLDDEDVAGKVMPLAGLNGLGNEGALIQPLRLAPITSPASGEAAGLWHYMVMRKRGPQAAEAKTLDSAVKLTTAADFKALFTAIAGSAASFASLTERLDTLCGEHSPPSSTITNTLIEAQDALRDISGLGLDLLTGEPVLAPVERAARPEPPAEAAAALPEPTISTGPAPLRTREDALHELARIASFFHEHEPNSPTAYALDTLIRRARLPLQALLAELIPDETMRRTYLTVAGIWPDQATTT